MLPFKAKPIVTHLENLSVEELHKELDSMEEEPVGNSGVVIQGSATTGRALWVFRADEPGQLWPLKISSTVSEEHSG